MKRLHARTILQRSVMPMEMSQCDMNDSVSCDTNTVIQIGELFEMVPRTIEHNAGGNSQVEIDFIVWAVVKHFDTLKGLSINAGSEHLLERGLDEFGYNVKRDMAVSAGGSLAAASQQTPP
jgi:hypothetical protein